MTTCEPLPDGGEAEPPLTLWPEDSPASPSASPGKASPRRIAGGSGQPSQTPFASYDPGTSSWKTSRVSLDGEWETYSETWPASGMTRNGTAFLLPRSVPHISGTGSSSWPSEKTPFGIPYCTTLCADDTGHRKKPYSQGGEALSYRLGGPVSPPYAEWLMGYPENWTDFGEKESECSATP